MEDRIGYTMGGLFMLGMAGLFGFLGAFMFWRGYKRQNRGCVAAGIVVGHQERQHGNGTTYTPEVEFQTRDGKRITFVATTGSNRRPAPGRKVKVLYYPADPEDADIASFATFWIMPLLLTAFAVGFATLSVKCFSRIP